MIIINKKKILKNYIYVDKSYKLFSKEKINIIII